MPDEIKAVNDGATRITMAEAISDGELLIKQVSGGTWQQNIQDVAVYGTNVANYLSQLLLKNATPGPVMADPPLSRDFVTRLQGAVEKLSQGGTGGAVQATGPYGSILSQTWIYLMSLIKAWLAGLHLGG